jgi:hypothetical protein
VAVVWVNMYNFVLLEAHSCHLSFVERYNVELWCDMPELIIELLESERILGEISDVLLWS